MTALKRRTRSMMKATISESMRYFLETGNYCLRDIFPNDPRGRGEVFRLAYPSIRMRDELRKIWLLHRDEILRIWKSEKKRGRPWAAKCFD